jgi:hypothetical protein
MSPIAEHSLEPTASRWLLVAAALAALFIAALVILGRAESAPAGDDVHALDNGL